MMRSTTARFSVWARSPAFSKRLKSFSTARWSSFSMVIASIHASYPLCAQRPLLLRRRVRRLRRRPLLAGPRRLLLGGRLLLRRRLLLGGSLLLRRRLLLA